MKVSLLLVLSLVILAGCHGTDNRPIVDTQGVNMAQYNTDLAECQAYADQVESGREVVRGW